MNDYLLTYRKILCEMILAMKSPKLTDSISYNFIVQMIPHHMAAIRMSENILKYTENKTLINIAESIIKEQTESISDMKKISGKCLCRKNTCFDLDSYQNALQNIMNTMFSQMKCAYSDCNNDCNFLREMIPHHEGAVRMSEKTLKYNICRSLKPILDSIISSQEKGIKQMKKLLF